MNLTLVDQVAFGTVCGVITLIGVVGNVIVMVAVISSAKMRRSVMNLLLAALALADFGNLVTGFFEWSQIVVYRQYVWMMWPDVMCSPIKYLNSMFLYASLLTQLLIGIERYIATLYPFMVSDLITSRNCVLSICSLWLFASGFAVPYLAYSVRVHGTNGICLVRNDSVIPIRPNQEGFKITQCLLFYFVPLSLFIFLYARIARLLWMTPEILRRRCTGEKSSVSRSSEKTYLSKVSEVTGKFKENSSVHSNQTVKISVVNETPSETPSHIRHHSNVLDKSSEASTIVPSKKRRGTLSHTTDVVNEEAMRQLKVRRRVVLMLVVCVLMYFLCYSPSQVLTLVHIFSPRLPVPYEVFLVTNCLCVANSACNPLIYAIFSQRFRVRIKDMLTPRCRSASSLSLEASVDQTLRYRQHSVSCVGTDHATLSAPSVHEGKAPRTRRATLALGHHGDFPLPSRPPATAVQRPRPKVSKDIARLPRILEKDAILDAAVPTRNHSIGGW